jgi:hypothetical protein
MLSLNARPADEPCVGLCQAVNAAARGNAVREHVKDLTARRAGMDCALMRFTAEGGASLLVPCGRSLLRYVPVEGIALLNGLESDAPLAEVDGGEP